MARRPMLEHMALHTQVPRGHEGLWTTICELKRAGEAITISAVHGLTNQVRRDTINDYFRRLERAGYLRRTGFADTRDLRGKQVVYELARASVRSPRLRRDGTELPEQATDTFWRSMKMMKTFTVFDIWSASKVDGRRIARASAGRYIRYLENVGVLAVHRRGGPRREAVYRLVKNIGALPPRILRMHVVYDPNANEVIGTAVTREVAA